MQDELLEKERLGEEKPVDAAPAAAEPDNAEVAAETSTAENGSNEASVVDNPENNEVNVGNNEGESEVGKTVPDTEPQVEPDVEPEPTPEPEPEKMLTQSQVNELVGKARAEGRASALKELYGRYGVNDDNELNDIFGKGQGYEVLNDEYSNLSGRYKDLGAENALLKTNIVPNRWDDVKAILSSKGLEISAENIEAELMTHPEWKDSGAGVAAPENKELSPEMLDGMANNLNKILPPDKQPSVIKKLGSNVPEPQVDQEDIEAMRMFGLK